MGGCASAAEAPKNKIAKNVFMAPLLTEEELAGIRAMNSGMARRTVLISRIGQIVVGGRHPDAHVERGPEASEIALAIVALQTQREHGGPAQQARVHRAVRLMTRFATLDRERAVFEHE